MERIYLNAKLSVLKEQYTKNRDQIVAVDILNIEMQLLELDTKLRPLFAQLKALQTKYLVWYEGEYSVPGSDKTYWGAYTEELWFKTACQVDTTQLPFTPTPQFEALFMEIHHFIYHQRFTNYKILGVRTL